MGTVDKALSLLDFFSERRPEIGLSDLTRLAGYDKATVLRLMTSLANRGFVEQDRKSKVYRLGPSLLRLANVREMTIPSKVSARPVLEHLSVESGETVHLFLLAKDYLEPIDFIETSAHATRVHMDAGERISLHASASGLACLAFMQVEDSERILLGRLERFTNHTITDAPVLQKCLAKVRVDGIAESDRGFEEEVFGIAAPIFSPDRLPVGSIGIATPHTRMTDSFRQKARALTRQAAIDITRAWGGSFPAQTGVL